MNDRQRGFPPSAQSAEVDARSCTSPKDAVSVPDFKSQSFNTTRVRLRSAFRIAASITLFLGIFSIGWFVGSNADRIFKSNSEFVGDPNFAQIVERIINVESGGNPNKKNNLSSATGLAQFLDQTWLELMAVHRPDLIEGRSQVEILDMRYNADLVREITALLVEHNAKILRRRNLPVTPGTLYLAHFAGTAGAVAILSGPENEKAASIMANADISRHTTPKKIVIANPFLSDFTVADLKRWADRKMENSDRIFAKASFIQR
jgi:hypothetical protein